MKVKCCEYNKINIKIKHAVHDCMIFVKLVKYTVIELIRISTRATQNPAENGAQWKPRTFFSLEK